MVAGYVAGSQAELIMALERERLHAGPILGAFEAWLVLRSLGTAGPPVRPPMPQCPGLGRVVARPPGGRAVRFPGLTGDPAHPVASAQMRRFGGLVSVELANAAAVHALVQRRDLLVAATSFGGIHTTVDRRCHRIPNRI